MNIFKKYFLVSFFIIFSLILGAVSYFNLKQSNVLNDIYFNTDNLSLFEKDIVLKDKHLYLEENFNKNFSNKLFFIEKYGYLQNILGKRMIDDAIENNRVFKGNSGMLYFIIPQKNISDSAVNNISFIKTELEKYHIPTIFIMPPNKHSINSENFPYGVLDYTTTNSDDMYQKLMEHGITTLNLNYDYFKEQMDDSVYFYKNNMHWKNETAFWAYQKTLEYFKDTLSYTYYNEDNSNIITNYVRQKFENSSVGDIGRIVGKDYIIEKDNYELILPAFDTNYSYKKYDENYIMQEEKLGRFEKVFIDKSVLESNEEYVDKYTAMMGNPGAYEIITNENIENRSKIVIIKDSFAMPYSAFLSTNISQIHLLDTRYENIRKTMINTIKTLNPDYVLFVCSPSSAYYYPEMFDLGAES